MLFSFIFKLFNLHFATLILILFMADYMVFFFIFYFGYYLLLLFALST